MAKARPKIDRDGNSGAGWYIPNVVSNSAAWRSMTLGEFRLITIAASLYSPKEGNNGHIALSFEYLKKHFDWVSEGTLVNARKGLEEKGLLLLTRKGDRNNIPGLYALTWLPLQRYNGQKLDIDPAKYSTTFRGEYARWTPPPKFKKDMPTPEKALRKISCTAPTIGVRNGSIAPTIGARN